MIERYTQRQIIEFLERQPDIWWLKTPPECRNGVPDLIGCFRGRFFGWELKSQDGKLTTLQQVEQGRILLARGQYRVMRSTEDARRAIEELKHARRG